MRCVSFISSNPFTGTRTRHSCYRTRLPPRPQTRKQVMETITCSPAKRSPKRQRRPGLPKPARDGARRAGLPRACLREGVGFIKPCCSPSRDLGCVWSSHSGHPTRNRNNIPRWEVEWRVLRSQRRRYDATGVPRSYETAPLPRTTIEP